MSGPTKEECIDAFCAIVARAWADLQWREWERATAELAAKRGRRT